MTRMHVRSSMCAHSPLSGSSVNESCAQDTEQKHGINGSGVLFFVNIFVSFFSFLLIFFSLFVSFFFPSFSPFFSFFLFYLFSLFFSLFFFVFSSFFRLVFSLFFLFFSFLSFATTLADLNAEGLNVQKVNDLLTMYVGAASQHVLRMSFVSEQEAHNFDRQVMTFTSCLVQRDITFTVVFSTPQAWRTWSGLCSSTPRGCSMARVAVDHSHVDGNNPVTGHRFPLQFNTTTTSSTITTPNHLFNINEQTTFPTQTPWSSPPPKNHSKETSLHHPKKHTQTIL